MTRDLTRRLERLESAQGAGNGEMVETTLGEQARAALRAVLIGIHGDEAAPRIDADLARPRLRPRVSEAAARELGEMARAALGGTIAAVEGVVDTRRRAPR